VHHDRALPGVIVEARLEAVEPQRIAVFADVGFTRAIETEARSVALGVIRERRRHDLPAAAAV
jgi:hypothetical protein